MADAPARDFFDKARELVSAALFVAGALAIVGSLLDWVTFTLDPPLFGVIAPRPSDPISGFDVGDGWLVAGAGVVLIAAAFLLVLRRRAGFAGLGLLASMFIGAIAISDYRGVGDLTSDLARELDLVGEPHAAIGLTLVVAASILGLIASVAGIAATPRGRS
ncbi:MAG TPA: hypothetical protein VIG64_15280 [Actinomycetota bacterium]|jgi:hypothetical protein